MSVLVKGFKLNGLWSAGAFIFCHKTLVSDLPQKGSDPFNGEPLGSDIA